MPLYHQFCCCGPSESCGDCATCASTVYIEVHEITVGINLDGTSPALVRWSAAGLRMNRTGDCNYQIGIGTGTIEAEYSTDDGETWTDGLAVLVGWDIECITEYCSEGATAPFFDVRVFVAISDQFGFLLIPSSLRFHWKLVGVACPEGHLGRFFGLEDGSVGCDVPTNPITLVSGDEYQVTAGGMVEVTT